MDNSFTLLSTMSPKTSKNKYITYRKAPTKLALKRFIRRSSSCSSIVAASNLKFTTHSTINIVESDTSVNENQLLDITTITIADSNTTKESDNSFNKPCKKSELSISTYKNVKDWIFNVEVATKNCKSDILEIESTCSRTKQNNINAEINQKKTVHKFEELLRGITQDYSNYDLQTSFSHLNIHNREHKPCVQNSIKDSFPIAIEQSTNINAKNVDINRGRNSKKEFDDSTTSSNSVDSADIIEDSDSSWQSNNKIYGTPDNYLKKTKNRTTHSEIRTRKNVAIHIPMPQTDIKPIKRWSIIHQNPYIDSNISNSKIPNKIKKPQAELLQRLKLLCDDDSDSGDDCYDNYNINPKIRLFTDAVNNVSDEIEPSSATALSNKLSAHLVNGEKYQNSLEKDVKLISLDKNNPIAICDGSPEDKLKTKFTSGQKTLLENKTSKGKHNHRSKQKENKEPDTSSKTDCKNVDNGKTGDKIQRTVIGKTKSTTKVLKTKAFPLENIDIIKGAEERQIIDCPQLSDNVLHKSFLASLSKTVKTNECHPSARIFRNNFKTHRGELAKTLFKLYNEKVFNSAIAENSPLEWSERMRGTAGYCYCKKITRSTGVIEREIRIVLAAKVLDSADRLRDTLIHEMCHAATWIVDKIADAHGNYWKAWVQKARTIFPELPPIKACHNYAINTKYTYRCVDCNYSFGRHTKSLNIETKRCGYCKGRFEILINKISKDGVLKSVPVTPKKEATGFALFVKDNYATLKTPQFNHGQVMKLLGQKFNELKLNKV